MTADPISLEHDLAVSLAHYLSVVNDRPLETLAYQALAIRLTGPNADGSALPYLVENEPVWNNYDTGLFWFGGSPFERMICSCSSLTVSRIGP